MGSNTALSSVLLPDSSVVRHASDVPTRGMRRRGGHPQVSPRHQHLRAGGAVRQVSAVQVALLPAVGQLRAAGPLAEHHLPLAECPPGQLENNLILRLILPIYRFLRKRHLLHTYRCHHEKVLITLA